jgi:uncharacterized repeat protein (TIGR01451 family)
MSKLQLSCARPARFLRNPLAYLRIVGSIGVGALLASICIAEETTLGLAIETIAETRMAAPSSSAPTSASVAYVPADRLQIGDEIYYSLRVRNTSPAAIQRAVVVRALPRNTRYVPGSAVGPAALVTYSVNGAKTFARADQLSVLSADGAVRSAIADDYTHIRWELKHPLSAGATAILRFRGVFK